MYQFAVGQLSLLRTPGDRKAAIESLGWGPTGPFKFVGDLRAPFSSIEAVAKVVLTALPQYEHEAKARFNYGVGKTSVMPMLDAPAPCPDEVGCPVVIEY